MVVAMFSLFLLCLVGGIVLAVLGYSRATPEQLEECNAQMRKAADEFQQGVQRWNEERRQAKAYKRARNAAVWKVVGKFLDRM